MKRIISYLGYPGILLLLFVLGFLFFFPDTRISNSVYSVLSLNISFFFVFFFSWICSKRSKIEFRLFFFIGIAYFLWGLLISQKGMNAGFAAIALPAWFYLGRTLFLTQKSKSNDLFPSHQGITYLLKQEENRVTGTIFCPIFENKIGIHSVHIPFCPPFESKPEVKFIPEPGNSITVTQLFVATYGMRMQIEHQKKFRRKKQNSAFKIRFQART